VYRSLAMGVRPGQMQLLNPQWQGLHWKPSSATTMAGARVTRIDQAENNANKLDS
jgi:hypothetical protein